MDRTTPVQILWTGGWDSTFRLLQLLLELKLEVIPHYVIDDTRESAPTVILPFTVFKRPSTRAPSSVMPPLTFSKLPCT